MMNIHTFLKKFVHDKKKNLTVDELILNAGYRKMLYKLFNRKHLFNEKCFFLKIMNVRSSRKVRIF
jgi:hypothetical protein